MDNKIVLKGESCLYFAPMGTDTLACSFHPWKGENNPWGILVKGLKKLKDL